VLFRGRVPACPACPACPAAVSRAGRQSFGLSLRARWRRRIVSNRVHIVVWRDVHSEDTSEMFERYSHAREQLRR
jgi:hypothetical protein